MKKILFYLLTIIAFIACSESDEVDNTIQPQLELNTTTIDFASEGGQSEVLVNSTEAWKVSFTYSTPEEWCDISPASGEGGKTKVVITAQPNNTINDRSVMIYFKSGKLSRTVIAKQKLQTIIATDSEYKIGADGGDVEIEIKSNVDFEFTIDESAKDWVKYETTRVLEKSTLVFRVAENEGDHNRTAEIKFNNEKMGIVEKVTIIQGYRSFSVKQKEYILPMQGCQLLVEVNYKEPYKILGVNGGYVMFTENNNGLGKSLINIGATNNERPKDIVISDEYEIHKDTIWVFQRETDEYIHSGDGNSSTAFYGGVCPYQSIVFADDVYTNLEDYEVHIFGNTSSHQIKYLGREDALFGYKEIFETPNNYTGKDLTFNLVYVGPNIAFPKRITVKRQLFVNFEEEEEMYISQNGETFTTHAWTEDDNLNIILEGEDTSWLIVKDTDDTYVDGVRRINTTFEALPNQTGETREISIIAYNGFDDKDIIRVIQPSGEAVLLSNENFYVGAWEGSYELLLKKCDYTLSIDGQASWFTYGEATEKNGALSIPINVEKYDGDAMREATIVIKSGDITNKVYVRQLPESGALIDDSDPKWKSFQLPEVKFENPYHTETGAMLYNAIVEDPKELIAIQSRRVLDLLYFSPDEPLIPRRDAITYKLDNFDGVSAFQSGGSSSGIILSNQYVESYYNKFGLKALVAENKGVLSHELTHSFQLSPQGVGDYNTNQIYHACVEGMADAVRVLSGGFPNPEDRPKGGSYLDSYRYTGFFIAWLVQNKDKDFLRKFNLSTQHVIPWSFDGAIKYALGEQYNVDDLWEEYLRAMGDIQ